MSNKILIEDGVHWRVHTPLLFHEIMTNNREEFVAPIKVPILIFLQTIRKVAERAIEIDDPKLNALMIQLTLFDEADPYKNNDNKHYDNVVKYMYDNL